MKRFKLNILFLLGALCLFAPAYASESDYINLESRPNPSPNGQLTIVGRRRNPNIVGSYPVRFFINGRQIKEITSNLDGSFSYTTPKDPAHSGGTLLVEVLHPDGRKKFERSFSIPVAATNPVTPPVAYPSPTQQPRNPPPYIPPPITPPPYVPPPVHTPPPYVPPAAPGVDPYKLDEYARVQARTVANRVARTYGQLENYRYNFSNGFWTSFVLEGAFLQQTPEYQAGYQKGRREAPYQGAIDGRQKGESLANQSAENEVRQRIQSILNTGQGPNPTVSVIPVACAPLTPSMQFKSVETLLDSLNAQLQTTLKDVRFEDDGFAVYFDSNTLTWSLREIYGYGRQDKYRFVDNWFRADFALEEWKNNRLGGRYDTRKYNELDYNQKSQFEQTFRAEYNRVIDEKFERVKRSPNPEANRQGVYYGQLALAKAAEEEGRKAGYTQVYQATSLQECNAILPQAFANAFQQKLADYQSHAYLETTGVKLLDGNGDGFYSIGENVGVQIPALTNLGGQPARVTISLAGEGLQATQSIELRVSPYSSIQVSDPRIRNLALVTENVPLDRHLNATLQIGGYTKSLGFQVRAADAFASFARSNSPSLRSQILRDLRAEFEACFSGRGLCYDAGNTKLKQLVDYYRYAPQNEKSVLVSLRYELNGFTARGFHPIKKKQFDRLVSELR